MAECVRESLGGAEILLETAGFKKTKEGVWWRTSANARRKWVSNWGAAMLKPCEAKTARTRRADNRLVLGVGQRGKDRHRRHQRHSWTCKKYVDLGGSESTWRTMSLVDQSSPDFLRRTREESLSITCLSDFRYLHPFRRHSRSKFEVVDSEVDPNFARTEMNWTELNSLSTLCEIN